jgi:hypothetical protein
MNSSAIACLHASQTISSVMFSLPKMMLSLIEV